MPKYGIGIKATVNGLPLGLSSGENLDSLISPKTLPIYTGMYHSPQKAVEGYADVLKQDFYNELIQK